MSEVHATAVIAEGAKIGEGVSVGPYSVIGPQVVLEAGCVIHPHVVIDGETMLGEGCQVFPFASIGGQTQDLKFAGESSAVFIGARTTLREYVTVNCGTTREEVTRIGSDCHIMAYCHVAHGCDVGDGVIMANGATLAGHVVVGDQAILGGLCGVHQFVHIGRLAMLAGMSRVVQDCPPFMTVEGNPCALRIPNSIGMKRKGISDADARAVRVACRSLRNAGLSIDAVVTEVEAKAEPSDIRDEVVAFLRKSERGVIR
jgi:UDP-N-acetylglucosamine acyltransferase